MKRSSILKALLVTALFVALIGIAGHEDYTDQVICEMQNNGVYDRYADAHPELSDAQLAELYLDERDK